MAEHTKTMWVDTTAVNVLHDWQQENVVTKTPHSFCAYNIQGVQIVVAQNLLLCDELSASEKLRNNQQNNAEPFRAVCLFYITGFGTDH